MKTPPLFQNVNAVKHRFVLDYDKDSESSAGVGESGRSLVFTEYKSAPAGKQIKRVYFEGDTLFVYTSDGDVYQDKDLEFTLLNIGKFASEPDIVCFIEKGAKKFLISGDEGSFLSDGTETGVEKGSHYAEHKNMLFIGKDRGLQFSEPFDLTDFKSGGDTGGIINTEYDDGEIECLTESGDSLDILCKNKVLVLTAAGEKENFSVTRLKTEFLDVEHDSAASVGDKTVFISAGRLCILYKSAVKIIRDMGASADFAVTGRASSFGSVYLLPSEWGGEEKLYCYDTADGKEYFLGKAEALSRSGGFAFDAVGGQITALKFSSDGGTVATFHDYDGTYDFGACAKKTLNAVGVHCKGTAKLVLSGDSAKKTYGLRDGCNQIKTKIESREFSVNFTDKSEGFRIARTVFEYTVNGE